MLVVTTLHKRAVQEATALLGPHDGGKSGLFCMLSTHVGLVQTL